jgi:hypothetical protein
MKIWEYATGERLEGDIHGDVADASAADEVGAVYAQLVDGMWRLVDASQVEALRACEPPVDVRAVYVTELS